MSAELAILIVTLQRRRPFFDRLMRRLEPQLSSRVAVYALEDSGAERIGRKRQRLIESVDEPYLCFVDDDDLVTEDYCASIMAALDEKPDVVGFRLRYFEDGQLRGNSIISVTMEKWSTEVRRDGQQVHYRTPNHLSPIRREMALAAGFPSLDFGEDAEYSHRIYGLFGKTMREVFIDRVLYDYLFRSPRLRTESETLSLSNPYALTT